MFRMQKPTIGTYVVGMTVLAMAAIGLVAGMPLLVRTPEASASAVLQFKNPFNAAVEKPHLAGEWMTFIDRRDNGIPAIYTYNFKTNEEKMLTWGQPALDASVTPRVYEGYVAYNNRLSNGTYVMNHMNPYMYVTKQIAASKHAMSAPSFDAQNIVWTQEDAELVSASQVYWYDADRSTLEQLTTGDKMKQSAVVRGTTAWWIESMDGKSWDIVQYELDLGARKTVLSGKPLVGPISASGNTVAYSQFTGETADIFTVNTITGAIKQITKTGMHEKYPVIFGDLVAYDEIMANKDAEIALYNLDTDTKVLLTNDTIGHAPVSITSDRLAWSDARTGTSQIYFYDFRSSAQYIDHRLNKEKVQFVGPSKELPINEEHAVDTDGDGLSDVKETTHYKTNPKMADTDGDGLSDYDEIFTHRTSPFSFDTDGDTYGDGTEVKNGYNPLVKAGTVIHYGVGRFDLKVEQAKAKELKAKLEAKLGKGKIGIPAKQWPFYVNAYVYGSYSVEEVIRSSHGGYGVISADVAAPDWRKTDTYLKAIDIVVKKK